MENFFKSIERRAFRLALFACRNRDDALDLVQESMCRFIDKYRSKPEPEWKALFYKILQNKIRDFYRREAVRSRWRSWLGRDNEDEAADPLEQLADPKADDNPESLVKRKQAMAELQLVLRQLTYRQQQVFLLRAWEGLSVKETASAMSCSEGTVKTHYFRAAEQLKRRLGDDWYE